MAGVECHSGSRAVAKKSGGTGDGEPRGKPLPSGHIPSGYIPSPPPGAVVRKSLMEGQLRSMPLVT